MNNNGIFQLYPLIPFALCLILGIIAGRYLIPYVSDTTWLAALIPCTGLCLILHKSPTLQSYALLLCTAVIGCTLITIAEQRITILCPDEETEYTAFVASEPVEHERTIRFDMLVASGPLCGQTVIASLLKDTADCRYLTLHAGSGIAACSVIQPIANFSGSSFDYVTYMKARGISTSTFIYYRNWQKSTVSSTSLSRWQRLRLIFIRYRHTLIERYRTLGLSDNNLAIVSAMTLGHRSAISKELRSAYSAAGVSHVLALSGMHLGIIYMLLSMFSAGRRFSVLRESLLVISIWAYVFMVGMPVSVVRSAIMLTVCSVVGLSGRDSTSLNTLAFAAILILSFVPFSIYDVGFQLSFLSVASILIARRTVTCLISPRFQQRHRLISWLWNLVVMSCAAQLATAPLVAYYFGTVSLYFLPANIVVVPAVTAVLYLSAAILATTLLPSVQQLLVSALTFVTDSLNSFIQYIASLPGATFTDIHINGLQLSGLYITIIAVALLCRIVCRRFINTQHNQSL